MLHGIIWWYIENKWKGSEHSTISISRCIFHRFNFIFSAPGWLIVLSACVNSDGRFWSSSYPNSPCASFSISCTQNHLVPTTIASWPTMIQVLLTNHPRFPTNLPRASFCCDVGKASAPKPTCITCNWMFGQKNSQLLEGFRQNNQNHTTIRFQDFVSWSWIAAFMNLWVKPASWTLWGKNRKGARLLDVYWSWASKVLSAWMKQPMRLQNTLRCHSAKSDGTRVLMNSRRTYIFSIGRPLETLRLCWWSLSSEGFVKQSSLEWEFGDENTLQFPEVCHWS